MEFEGYGSSAAGLVNDGNINVSGWLDLDGVSLAGSGTVSVDQISQAVSPPAPSFLLVEDTSSLETIGMGQTVDLNGGVLELGSASSIRSYLAIQGLNTNTLNKIIIENFYMSYDSFAGGVLTLTGTNNNGVAATATMSLLDITPQNSHIVCVEFGKRHRTNR
jgi:hypothetical protein